MATAYGLLQRHARYGQHFVATMRELQRLEYATEEVLREYQTHRLKVMLQRSADHVPYYRKLFASLGCSVADLAEPRNFSRLPILSKEEVRQNRDDLISDEIGTYAPRLVHTSGTTGKALQFPVSSYAFQREYAFRASHYSWAGISFRSRERMAFAAGHPVASAGRKNPPFWSYDYANRWLLFSSYHLSEANLPAYVRELERFSPVLLSGYPSSLYLLARAYRKWGSGNLRLRAVFAASETLLHKQRETIEAAFDCKVFVWYGNTELSANIVECEYGSLHGRPEHSLTEVVDDEGKPAREGRLICTGFGNLAFPLIRYDIGDVVRLSNHQDCACGRRGTLYESIVGRVEDYIVTPDGRFVGRLDHIFKDAVNVVEAQLIQHSVEHLNIRMVRRPEYREDDENAIKAEARSRLGSTIGLSFEYVDSLERTAHGKTRFIISSLGRQTPFDRETSPR